VAASAGTVSPSEASPAATGASGAAWFEPEAVTTGGAAVLVVGVGGGGGCRSQPINKIRPQAAQDAVHRIFWFVNIAIYPLPAR